MRRAAVAATAVAFAASTGIACGAVAGPAGSTSEVVAGEESETTELEDGRGNALVREVGDAGEWYCEVGGSYSHTIGSDEAVNEASPRDTIERALEVSGVLAGRGDEVIGRSVETGEAAVEAPLIDSNRSQTTELLGRTAGSLRMTVLLEDPNRTTNKAAGEAVLRFTPELGWSITSLKLCTSAQTGKFTPYVVPLEGENSLDDKEPIFDDEHGVPCEEGGCSPVTPTDVTEPSEDDHETVDLDDCPSGRAVESESMVDLDAAGLDTEWEAVASTFNAGPEPDEAQSTSVTTDDAVRWSVRSAEGDLVGVAELVTSNSGGWIVSYSATCVAQ